MASNTLIVLVHGFCCRAHHLAVWRDRLAGDYDHILSADLPASHRSFKHCLAELTRQISSAHPERYDEVYFAGHSMGGLLCREYLRQSRLPNARKLVCAGTPHKGSELANIALWIPLAGVLYPPLRALRPAARRTVTRPDLPQLEIGAIVGTNNAHWPGKLFLPDGDGLVTETSAHCPDAVETVYTTVPHDPMQRAPEIADLIRNFFKNSHF